MQNKLTFEEIAQLDPVLAEWLPTAVKHHIEGGGADEAPTAPDLWPHRWIKRGLATIEKLIDGPNQSFALGIPCLTALGLEETS